MITNVGEKKEQLRTPDMTTFWADQKVQVLDQTSVWLHNRLHTDRHFSSKWRPTSRPTLWIAMQPIKSPAQRRREKVTLSVIVAIMYRNTGRVATFRLLLKWWMVCTLHSISYFTGKQTLAQYRRRKKIVYQDNHGRDLHFSLSSEAGKKGWYNKEEEWAR